MIQERTDDMTDVKLIFQKPTNAEELRSCALFQRKLFEILTKDHGLMWDEILFPCADARSVLAAQNLGEPSVFGTHAIICHKEKEVIDNAAKKAAKETQCHIKYRIKSMDSEPNSIKKALHLPVKGFEGMLVCADFSQLVSGCDENWRIRDCSRKFLSFAETANDKAGKSLVGILGGKAVFDAKAELAETISRIYTSKTGCMTKVKIQ